jgi:hypothetical protein
MQADLENLGGVAALAAADSVEKGISLRAVDVSALQARLVIQGVLPARVLARPVPAEVSYTDGELSRMIAALPEFPLHEYSDMELTDRFEGLIPLVELGCAGPRVVPLLEEAHETAQGERKVRLAQLLALTGSAAGVPTLIEAILPQLDGVTLPPRTTHIRYTQLPPDHGAMPEVVHLLYSLGMTPDARALPVWERLAGLLAGVRESDFYEELKGTFYYVDAFGYGAERLATPALIPLLSQVHAAGPFHNRMATAAFEADFVLERLAYLELVLGRALARCGAVEGFLVLAAYLTDNRALLAEHAHTELQAITGEDYGKDASAWSQWIEQNADSLVPRPHPARTEAMDAWPEETHV